MTEKCSRVLLYANFLLKSGKVHMKLQHNGSQ